MLLQLGHYDLNIIYIQGNKIPLADTLSWKHLPGTYQEYSKGMDANVHNIFKQIPVTDQKKEDIKTATKQNPELEAIINIIQNGWLELKKLCHTSIIEHWNHHDELTYIEGLILKSNKILIARSFRT